jgi:cytidylate kinase
MLKEGAISERDTRDKSRKASPLTKAEGAQVVDTTELSIDEACEKALSFI